MNHSRASSERFASALVSLTDHPNAAVIFALVEGSARQAELASQLRAFDESELIAVLRDLDAEGFVARRVDSGPPLRVLYELTPRGATLATALHSLRGCARRTS